MDCAIDLAVLFKCSPFEFLGRPAEQVFALYKITQKRMRETAAD